LGYDGIIQIAGQSHFPDGIFATTSTVPYYIENYFLDVNLALSILPFLKTGCKFNIPPLTK
jgi:hypothetical protein